MHEPQPVYPNMVRRTLAALLVASIAACGGEPGAEPTSGTAPVTSRTAAAAIPETSTTIAAPTTSPSTVPPATVAADAAPDFTLELGNGGTFVLSEEARPVFLVFWAEW